MKTIKEIIDKLELICNDMNTEIEKIEGQIHCNNIEDEIMIDKLESLITEIEKANQELEEIIG